MANNQLKNLSSVDVFRITLGAISFIHVLQLIRWGYHTAIRDEIFNLPILKVLAGIPHTVHYYLYGVMLAASVFVTLGVFLRTASVTLGLLFLYSDLFDFFGFHHDIFLAANLFLLIPFVTSKDKKTQKAGRQCVCVLLLCVYAFAGINKASADFLKGDVVLDILQTTQLGKLIANNVPGVGVVSAIIACLGELTIPLLLLTRYRVLGVIIGAALHFGISMLGERGMAFNFYVLAMYIMFFPERKTVSFHARDLEMTIFFPKNILLTAVTLMFISLYALRFSELVTTSDYKPIVGAVSVTTLCGLYHLRTRIAMLHKSLT